MIGGSGNRATRRRILFSTVGILATLGTTACGAAQPQGGMPAKPAKISGKITFLAREGDVEVNGQKTVLLPTFKQAYPDIEVEHLIVPGSPVYNEKLLALWAAGTPPDVWGFGMNYMAYWARGMVMALDPLINRDKINLDALFLPGLPDKFKVHGKHYGMPQLTTFGTLLFYNKNLFDQEGIKYPPVDWDDKSWTYDKMIEIAQKLTKNPGTPDATYGLSYGPQMPNMAAWNFGGDSFRPEHYTDGIAPSSVLDSAESIAAHEFYQDVYWKYHVNGQPGKDPGTPGWSGGRLAMTIGGGWNFWGYSTIKDFKWAAAAIPWKVNNKNTAYNDQWELSSQSKNVDAAWAFIKHVTSPEIQIQYSQLTGTPPTTKGAIESWYKRYEDLMPRADLEKLTQGAIDPKRSQESPDHLFIDYDQFVSNYYSKEILPPIQRNEGKPREIIAAKKPAMDSIIKGIYDTWKGKTPS